MAMLEGRRGVKRKKGIPMPGPNYGEKNGSSYYTEEEIQNAARPIVTATLTLQRERDDALVMVNRLQDEVRQLRERLNSVVAACLSAAKETKTETDARLASLAEQLDEQQVQQ